MRIGVVTLRVALLHHGVTLRYVRNVRLVIQLGFGLIVHSPSRSF
jgi:hypothetical protein